jgi:radical SAM superfamily enzyme YgiQ (UPF0313 family)
VLEICEKFKERKFHEKLKWNANVRANLVTDKIIRAMRDAGCYEVRMGVESGNDYIRNKIYNKKMTKKQFIKAFELIRKNGVQLKLDFIIGAPFKTQEMMPESLEFAEKSQGDQIFFTKLYPFPGTKIKKICEQEKIIEKDANFEKNGMTSVDRTIFISNKQLNDFVKKISLWQMKRYIKEGLKRKKIRFFYDILLFLFYYKYKYDLQLNQIYRWNIQRYKLNIA